MRVPLRHLARTLPLTLLAAGALRAQGDDANRARLRDAEVARSLAQSQSERAAAESLARRGGWSIKGTTADGQGYELFAISPAGIPLYNTTLAINAALSANAPVAHALTPSIRGAGAVIGVWDQGSVRTDHVEFDDGGASRVTVADAVAQVNHSTAVTGVAIAAGVDAGVLGSAPAAMARSYDWNNSIAEMIASAPLSPADDTEVIASNHSYGFSHGWENTNASGNAGWHWFGEGYKPDGTGAREDEKFGKYSTYSRQLDDLSGSHPWHLILWAAGNDRDDGMSAAAGTFYYFDSTSVTWQSSMFDALTGPFADQHDGGFDTVITRASAKNVVTVGSVTDAVTIGVRDPLIAAPSSFSGWGPADDGRIKPDVVANGQGVRMPTGTTNSSYAQSSGTSYSTPSATGVAALIHGAARIHAPGWMPRACTVKALLIQGATDIGNPGPDAKYGWGLVDALASVQPVAALGDSATASSWPVVEGLLDAGTPIGGDTYTVQWDGVAPLKATVCWTDPPGVADDTTLDLRTPVLVNDLDLRVSGPDGTFMPFRLDYDAPGDDATTGDNVVDPVEQVIVPAGSTAGTWTVTVSHKGVLDGGSQWYGLVITGQQAVAASSLALSTVDPPSALIDAQTTVTVEGTTILPGSQVLLRLTGNPDIVVTGEFTTRSTVAGAVDLTGAPAGAYDVVVSRPDGEEATLPAAFTVTDPSGVGEWQLFEQ